MRKSHRTKNQNSNKVPDRHKTQPFIAHLIELRQRLFFIAFFVILFTGLGAVIRERLIAILLKPAENQQFIYTTPGGGFDFNFRVCLYFGFALTVPVLIYHLFRYLEPLLKARAGYTIFRTTLFSTLLAGIGIVFGYVVGLPAALNFLLNQFKTDQIEALLSIQDYMSFVMIYLVGFALLFQIPLILLFINRIKPLKPKQLFGYQRFVILGAFVVAALITPTPDVLNQALMAGPIILMYQLGVILVWLVNRKTNISIIEELRQKDEVIRAERIARAQQQKPIHVPTQRAAPKPIEQVISQPKTSSSRGSTPIHVRRPIQTTRFSTARNLVQ